MYFFTKDCMIGIPDIDEEHRHLFDLLNETSDLLESGAFSMDALKSLITELKHYAGNHFIHEEAYMREISDPELPRQHREHVRFVEKINSYDLEHIAEDNMMDTVQEMLAFLDRWLHRHILGSDILIGRSNVEDEDPFAFTSKYKIGIELLDQEHASLFEITKAVYDLIHDDTLDDKYNEIVQILERLKEYTVQHFSDEEKYMESINYRGLGNQKTAHAAFIARLDEINLADIKIAENQQEYLTGLITFLQSWLSKHILKIDKLIPAKKL